MPSAAVLIPLYKKMPSAPEAASLLQCAKILRKHPVIFFAPNSLNFAPYLELIPQAQTERFDDSFFIGIPGCSRLMLSADF